MLHREIAAIRITRSRCPPRPSPSHHLPAFVQAFQAAPRRRSICLSFSSWPAMHQSNYAKVFFNNEVVFELQTRNSCRSIALELLWATGCLIGSSVPFPLDECRACFKDLLQYIDAENEKNIMHALVCCLGTTLAKLCTPPVAVATAASGATAAPDSAAARPQHQDEKRETIRALIKLLSQVLSLPPPTSSNILIIFPSDAATSAPRAKSSRLTSPLKLKAIATAVASCRVACLPCRDTRCLTLRCRSSLIASTAWRLRRTVCRLRAARSCPSYQRS